MEYIEREALLAEIDERISNLAFCSPYQNDIDTVVDGMQRARDSVEDAPAADVAPVVHGRWEDHMVRDWRCSECGEKIHKIRKVDGYCYDDLPNFCPNCGARMRCAEDE